MQPCAASKQLGLTRGLVRLQASVIEARMDKGMGPVATIIVERGTLKAGAIVAVGTEWGKVRAGCCWSQAISRLLGVEMLAGCVRTLCTRLGRAAGRHCTDWPQQAARPSFTWTADEPAAACKLQAHVSLPLADRPLEPWR